ncbi:hypothetical protein ONA91_37810 [Micromonospora sp. DR5-3]|uniref:hypothetical protein n=1 Tax=unclassified Micromonospora TaxID=2617518 RepID=UPI0011D32856|nr:MULTISPECIES: hypothetical protein [unclassified Micromonospora]MCW3820202.1 hypothetical protein [Micromonospora sp. DR5-3]TYC20402.1 hypothetical protein FXF52_31625 [Micromonospora sp. MP36]
MQATAELAGFFAAHGIWCVSDGDTLTPLLGYEQADGSRGMDRFVTDDLGESARRGQGALQNNEHESARAVLVVDGYVHLDAGRTDALIVEAVDYAGSASFKVAVPYRPRQSSTGFAVHRPKFVEVTGVQQPDYAALAQAFFAGVDSHEEAAAVWSDHLDETI